MTPAQDKKMRAAIRKFALGLPGAYEEFPWEEWVEESYRLIAPKKLVKELDA